MAKRGQNSGPGSPLWFVLMDSLLVQSFCRSQHVQLEPKLGDLELFKQFQNKIKRKSLYRAHLMKLQRHLVPSSVNKYFPGLGEQINSIQYVQSRLLLLSQGK